MCRCSICKIASAHGSPSLSTEPPSRLSSAPSRRLGLDEMKLAACSIIVTAWWSSPSWQQHWNRIRIRRNSTSASPTRKRGRPWRSSRRSASCNVRRSPSRKPSGRAWAMMKIRHGRSPRPACWSIDADDTGGSASSPVNVPQDQPRPPAAVSAARSTAGSTEPTKRAGQSAATGHLRPCPGLNTEKRVLEGSENWPAPGRWNISIAGRKSRK